MSKLSHLDDQGRASMVDVSEKSATERMASAEAIIVLSEGRLMNLGNAINAACGLSGRLRFDSS